MKYLLCSLAVILLCAIFTQNLHADESKETVNPDKEAPVILVEAATAEDDENGENKTLVITVERDSDFNIKDYVDIQENSGEFRLISYGKYDITKNGSYKLKLIAIDKSGNSASKDLEINVVEPQPKYSVRRVSQETVQHSLAANGSSVGGDAYSIASGLVGMGGWCTDVANAFLASFYGDGSNCFDTYPVSASEAKPGDVIYYADGGLGMQHYAIYLGGDTALQGNFLGTTQIRGVYLNNASEPQFYRPNGH